MNFITEYVSLLMQHPLATPVASLGLLALTLHLVLPLLCEIWRYYPNKITGTETLKNAYLEVIEVKLKGKILRERWYLSSKYPTLYEDIVFKHKIDAEICSKKLTFWSRHYLDVRRSGFRLDNWTDILTFILIVTFVLPLAALLIEYLLASFFIYTLVAGLAVGLHFTVVLLGKKLYSVSEDVKALKEHNKKENNDDD